MVTYEDLMGLEFRLLPATDLYVKSGSFWKDMSGAGGAYLRPGLYRPWSRGGDCPRPGKYGLRSRGGAAR